MCSKGKYWDVKMTAQSPNSRTIAFIAGFLEGDGSFYRNKTTHEVSVCQKDPWILYGLQSWLGGSVGEIHRQGANKATYHRWRASGARARGIMMTVYQFVSPRNKLRIKEALNVY